MLPTVAVRMAGGESQPENENVADPFHGDKTDDAGRWWRAYQLAENDQVDELRRLAAAGDDHARRQLASWLSDRASLWGPAGRAKVEEAIEVIRPLADAGDDVAELWLARWLADFGHKASQMHLARTLAREGRLEELRQRAGDGDEYARYWLDEALSRLACAQQAVARAPVRSGYWSPARSASCA
jgi:hypothetical protein